MAAIDPARCKPERVRGLVVVEQTFSGVKDFLLPDTAGAQLVQHVLEVSRRRLIGADVLCGDDRVEFDVELRSADTEIVIP